MVCFDVVQTAFKLHSYNDNDIEVYLVVDGEVECSCNGLRVNDVANKNIVLHKIVIGYGVLY